MFEAPRKYSICFVDDSSKQKEDISKKDQLDWEICEFFSLSSSSFSMFHRMNSEGSSSMEKNLFSFLKGLEGRTTDMWSAYGFPGRTLDKVKIYMKSLQRKDVIYKDTTIFELCFTFLPFMDVYRKTFYEVKQCKYRWVSVPPKERILSNGQTIMK